LSGFFGEFTAISEDWHVSPSASFHAAAALPHIDHK
jgi:hypothetical protein